MTERLSVVCAAVAAASCPVLAAGSALAWASVRTSGSPQGYIVSISCTSARNCAAVGQSSANGRYRLFVVTEKKGAWGKAAVVPGLGSHLDYAQFSALSCSSAGNCGAGGNYVSGNVDSGFVVSEKNGLWGKAEQVPGLPALTTGGGSAVLTLMTCTSGGNCLGIGGYSDSSGRGGNFAVTGHNGTWGQAQPIQPIRGIAGVTGVSCSSAGNCSAIGERPESAAAFVIHQVNGVWGAPIPVRGLGALPGGGAEYITFDSLSCPSAGNCAAVGFYFTDSGAVQPFVVTEKNGAWGRARVLPGLARLNTGQFAESPVVACRSAGNCSAAGSYDGSKQPNTIPGDFQVFVSTEKNGVWGKATELPGIAALNRGRDTSFPVLSCGAPGNCSLGGGYHGAGGFKPFIASQKHGIWGKAHEVSGFDR